LGDDQEEETAAAERKSVLMEYHGVWQARNSIDECNENSAMEKEEGGESAEIYT